MRFLIATLLSLLAIAGAACGSDGNADPDGDSAQETTTATDDATAVQASDRAGVDVTGQETVIALSSEFRDALEREGIEIEALAPARLNDDAIVLPIDGGRVSIEDGAGTVDHSGTIALRRGGETVEISDAFVDTRSGTVYGIVGGTRVRMFTLDASDLAVQKAEDHLVAGDLKVMVASDGAAVLDEELGASVEAGQEVGTMSVRLVPRLPDAAGAPETPGDAREAGDDALDELRSLEERARALADQAGEADLPAADRERIEEAARSLERALGGS